MQWAHTGPTGIVCLPYRVLICGSVACRSTLHSAPARQLPGHVRCVRCINAAVHIQWTLTGPFDSAVANNELITGQLCSESSGAPPSPPLSHGLQLISPQRLALHIAHRTLYTDITDITRQYFQLCCLTTLLDVQRERCMVFSTAAVLQASKRNSISR